MLGTNVKVPGMLVGMYYFPIAHCMQVLTPIVWQLYRYGLRWHAHNSRLELWVVLGWISEDHVGRRRTGCGTRPHALVNRFMQLQVFSVFFCIFDNHPQPSTYVAIYLLCYQRATPLAEDTSKSTGLLQTQNEGEWPVINADDVHSNVAFTTVAAAGLGKRRKNRRGQIYLYYYQQQCLKRAQLQTALETPIVVLAGLPCQLSWTNLAKICHQGDLVPVTICELFSQTVRDNGLPPSDQDRQLRHLRKPLHVGCITGCDKWTRTESPEFSINSRDESILDFREYDTKKGQSLRWQR